MPPVTGRWGVTERLLHLCGQVFSLFIDNIDVAGIVNPDMTSKTEEDKRERSNEHGGQARTKRP
jgi:hypothetical protein